MTGWARRATAVVTFAVSGGLVSTLVARPAELAWEQAFPVASAAPTVYVDAHFVGSDGGQHRLQIWRRGTAFLHRRTDAALDLFLERADDQADYRYHLFEHRRQIRIGVKRDQLYRIGVFSDWFGLAHVLDRPKTAFHVYAVAPLPGERRADCRWRLLERASARGSEQTRVCWSAAWGVPLVIRTPAGKGTWVDRFAVDRVLDDAIPSEGMVLPPAPAGYAVFDAGKEIAPEEGD